jgi:branched-chain amino acid transport system ATP-binding protein
MPLLECRGLVRRFGALVAVDAVDMRLDAGKIRAVIGPNGAGKSTVFNLITSVLKPTAGEVIFAGENITGLPVHVVAQKGHRPHLSALPCISGADRARERADRGASA